MRRGFFDGGRCGREVVEQVRLGERVRGLVVGVVEKEWLEDWCCMLGFGGLSLVVLVVGWLEEVYGPAILRRRSGTFCLRSSWLWNRRC